MTTAARRGRAPGPLADVLADLHAAGLGPATAEDYRLARDTADDPGDPAAQARVIGSNIGLAISAAGRLAVPGTSIGELFAAACVGLCRAAANFDSDRGVRFSTYAYRCIFHAILAERTLLTVPVTMPVEARSLGGCYRRAAATLGRAGGDAADPLAVAAAAGIERRKARYARSAAAVLGRPVLHLADEPGTLDAIPDRPDGPGALDATIEAVRAAVAALPEPDREVIRLLYGLDGRERLDHTATGARFGRSKGWPGQIADRALRRLRPLIAEELD